MCPWNDQLVQYIFINFPEERKETSILAKRFHVDLSDIFEDILKKEYTEDARCSEEAAQRAKARIKSIMQEYHISESATLDQLECDCMERICKGYEQADIDTCFGLIRDLETYDALEKIRRLIFKESSSELVTSGKKIFRIYAKVMSKPMRQLVIK